MADATCCRVLLVEDDAGDAHLVQQELRAARDGRFDVTWVISLAEAKQQLRDNPPDVLLLDLSLPDSSGLDTVRAGRLAAGTLPLIVLTGHDDTSFALRTLDAGAQDYLVKGSFDADTLVRAIRHAVNRVRLETRDHLLVAALEAVGLGVVITDIDANIEWTNLAFETLSGYAREEAIGRRPAELVKSGRHDRPFYEVMWQTILAGETWRGEIINKRKDGTLYDEELVIAPVKNATGEIRHFVGVKQDISERKRLEAELRELATTDSLTGLPNRRHFLARLEDELARLQRLDSQRAAVLMLDLDHFKRVNDRYGHAVGDAVLRHFATLMRGELRKIDTMGRVGGEEFALILPGADAAAAQIFAERLRQQTAQTPLQQDGDAIPITVSIGIAVMNAADASADVALLRADHALYRAKESGRNRVEVAD